MAKNGVKTAQKSGGLELVALDLRSEWFDTRTQPLYARAIGIGPYLCPFWLGCIFNCVLVNTRVSFSENCVLSIYIHLAYT